MSKVIFHEDMAPPSATESNLPWDKLQVGKGCFDVPGDKTSKLSSARNRAEKALNASFKTKKVVVDNQAFIRVWRVK